MKQFIYIRVLILKFNMIFRIKFYVVKWGELNRRVFVDKSRKSTKKTVHM